MMEKINGGRRNRTRKSKTVFIFRRSWKRCERRVPAWGLLWLVALVGFVVASGWSAVSPCEIEVVEKGTGWPVPLVELKTTHGVSFVTDNAGVVAFDLPEMLGRETWFDVRGQGYGVKTDRYGCTGVRFTPTAGGRHRVEVERTIIARRLGRVTGAGLFGESQKVGGDQSWVESGIVGCDSIQNTVYRGKLFWLWGDTVIPNYSLGIFDGTSAVTGTRPLTNFEPPLRLKFDYFQNDRGAPRGIAKIPGPGPTWITGYTSVKDAGGREHLVASYMKVHGHLDIYQWGLATWNDAKGEFEPLRVLWEKSEPHPHPPLVLDGHVVSWNDRAGKKWLLFCNPFPAMRCPATFEAWQNTNTWEKLEPRKTLAAADTGETVQVHSGSVAWNPWRKCWVTIFVQANGKSSMLGEVWYAEADTPMGPWGPAVKVLSHDNYTFYNPALHPEFVPDNSPVLIFEGTYTAEFANRPPVTPRYNYNQILYRLDLDDPRLLPAHQR